MSASVKLSLSTVIKREIWNYLNELGLILIPIPDKSKKNKTRHSCAQCTKMLQSNVDSLDRDKFQ